MLSMENSQNVPKNKFIKKIVRYLGMSSRKLFLKMKNKVEEPISDQPLRAVC